ncbi:PEP-utilizing enzyme [Brevibacillus sp. WF146]|uniref:phosphoenolpyruvate-utilizing N-terminal domain-containing protein n=1 Tax=Brevibacillus sp. WF146 TaxID=319501 RepID=UPI0007ECFA27|nr:phosphoenolpyruvate-utilizing N-terminal domain-containing protein [Brevibacillus sp. WF146]UYZ12264.1 PEP-utilizing enzyme [Brevibacillus sp. WF146]
MHKGIAASPGYAAGQVLLLREGEPDLPRDVIAAPRTEAECQRFRRALERAKADIVQTRDDVKERLGEHECAIFDSHLLMLEDPVVVQEVEAEIAGQRKKAAWAVHDVFSRHAAYFSGLDDAYFQERAADFRDLGDRLVRELLGMKSVQLDAIDRPVIVVARDLTPSQTARLNPAYIKGIVTEIGGTTSHSAILARSLGIPAVVGCGPLLGELTEEDWLALDGCTGGGQRDENGSGNRERTESGPIRAANEREAAVCCLSRRYGALPSSLAGRDGA